MTKPDTIIRQEWIPLSDKESVLAVDSFNKAMPGVYGVPEAIDKMLAALWKAGIISRTPLTTKSPSAEALSRAILEAHAKWADEYCGVSHA